MNINNFPFEKSVIKVEKNHHEDEQIDGNMDHNLRVDFHQEYPIDIDEIKVEGIENTTSLENIIYMPEFIKVEVEDENYIKTEISNPIINEDWHDNDYNSKPASVTDSNRKSSSKRNNRVRSQTLKSKKSTNRAGMKKKLASELFECKMCNKNLADNGSLRRHMLMHTGEKPYVCDVCSKAYRQKPQLKVHMRIHTGEKPYACNLCSSKFREKRCLKSHIQTHMGEKPFVCSICFSKFREKSILTKHMLIHPRKN